MILNISVTHQHFLRALEAHNQSNDYLYKRSPIYNAVRSTLSHNNIFNIDWVVRSYSISCDENKIYIELPEKIRKIIDDFENDKFATQFSFDFNIETGEITNIIIPSPKYILFNTYDAAEYDEVPKLEKTTCELWGQLRNNKKWQLIKIDDYHIIKNILKHCNYNDYCDFKIYYVTITRSDTY